MRCDARAGVHCDAADSVARELDLARVQACAEFDPERADRIADRLGRTDRARRAVERREETVAGRVDLASPETLELTSDESVMLVEQVAPGPVAELA
jgi:hypothetical protein